jgi:nucleotide-binding universal stress UspA family protein
MAVVDFGQSIVVGTDGSETAMRAVQHAADLARATGARVHLVSAYKPLTGVHVAAGAGMAEITALDIEPTVKVNSILDQAAAVFRMNGVEVETHACKGDPAAALLDVADAQGATMIVVGNKGMDSAKRYFLGNVPDKVSHHAPCSVLIVRTDVPAAV